MARRFKIGVIGAGMWGLTHIEAFKKERRAEVTWVCSASEISVSNAVKRYDIPHSSLDYHDLLKDPTLDAVVVATPPNLHASMTVDAIKAGKYVLLEKPMVASRREMDLLLAEAARYPKQIILECSCRHSRLQPKFNYVKKMIDEGRLGRVYFIHHTHLIPTTFIEYNPKGVWALDKAQAGGGPFFDWGVYDLSFHLGILGDEPKLTSLESFTINGLRDMSAWVSIADVEQHGAAWMAFNTGLRYFYERGAGVHFDSPNETRILGTEGGIRLSFPTWETNEIQYYHVNAEGRPVQETLRVDMSDFPDNDNSPLVSHFLDCLEGTALPMMPVSLAAKHLDILFRILD